MTQRVIFGVDPGTLGAIIVLADGEPVDVRDMPTISRVKGGNDVNGQRIADFVRITMAAHKGADFQAVLEIPSTRPGESPTLSQRSGINYGVVKGVLQACGIDCTEVRPQVWKKHFALIGTKKDQARVYAMNRFITRGIWFSRKKDGGRADAALIATWCNETEAWVS